MSGFVSSGFSVGKGASPEARTLVMAIVGGTASELGGGKFSNGALGSVFQYMFNDLMDQYARKAAFGDPNASASQIRAVNVRAAQGFSDGAEYFGEAGMFFTYIGLEPLAAGSFGASMALDGLKHWTMYEMGQLDATGVAIDLVVPHSVSHSFGRWGDASGFVTSESIESGVQYLEDNYR